MNTQIDLKNGCLKYSSTVQKTLKNLFLIETKHPADQRAVSVSNLEEKEDLYFSILFTGEVYGEFLIGLTKTSALKLMGFEVPVGEEARVYELHRVELLDLFKEVTNIAAAQTIGYFKDSFPGISITPPKSIEGHFHLSSYKIEKFTLHHQGGTISCYVYVDFMKLEINETLENNRLTLLAEKEKQAELKRLDKAKSEFLANMSHELRTPLNGIIGMLDVLKMTELNQTQQEQFNIIYRSGEFLLSLISDVLEFSKIESGKLEIETKPFLLRQSIERVAESLSAVVMQKGLDFNLYIDPQIQGQYLGDETRLKQILINLIGNAVKFTPSGAITVSAECSDQDLVLAVADTGVGIPAHKIETIFQSFSQADVSDSRKYGGTGLGLTITKSIVEAMNGSIKVNSVEAKGTEFVIRIPMPLVEPAALKKIDKLKFSRIQIVTMNPIFCDHFQSYIRSLNSAAQVSFLEHDQEVTAQKGELLILEFQIWQKMNEVKKQKILEEVATLNTYMLFLTRPKDLSEMTKLACDHFQVRMYFMNLPIYLEQLAMILEQQPRLEKAIPKAHQTVVIPFQTKTNKQKILIAEDNLTNQVVIKNMLEQLGYDFEVVQNGREALQKISDGQKFDLILMDCQMPEMNGYVATQEIRKFEEARPEQKRVPIIALTANAFRETKEECFLCGMDDFSTKPIKFSVLKELIQKMLAKYGN